MKKFIAISTCTLTLFISSLTFVQSAQGAEAKIAVLDLRRAIFSTAQAKELEATMQVDFAEDQAKIKTLAQEAQELKAKFDKDGSIMSDAEKRKVAGNIQEKGVNYEFLVKKLQKAGNEKQQRFIESMRPQLLKAVNALVAEEDYDIVLSRDSVVYVGSSYEITAKVIEKLNQQK